MARTLSQDLRDRVIAAADGGIPQRCRRPVRGGVYTAVRWLRAWRPDGMVAARPKGGDLRSRHSERHRDVILTVVDAQVDITLVELAALLCDRLAWTLYSPPPFTRASIKAASQQGFQRDEQAEIKGLGIHNVDNSRQKVRF